MNVQEWKDLHKEKCENVLDAYKVMSEHINALDSIEDSSIDEDELVAFLSLKLIRLNKEIEKLFG